MPPKPPRGRDDHPRPHWFATHRVNASGQWQAVDWSNPSLPWINVPYEAVPDQLWSKNFRRDGWKFYTDRTRPCDERGFPLT